MNIDLNDFHPTTVRSRASTMPARWSVQPEFFQLEKEKIFWKTSGDRVQR